MDGKSRIIFFYLFLNLPKYIFVLKTFILTINKQYKPDHDNHGRCAVYMRKVGGGSLIITSIEYTTTELYEIAEFILLITISGKRGKNVCVPTTRGVVSNSMSSVGGGGVYASN